MSLPHGTRVIRADDFAAFARMDLAPPFMVLADRASVAIAWLMMCLTLAAVPFFTVVIGAQFDGGTAVLAMCFAVGIALTLIGVMRTALAVTTVGLQLRRRVRWRPMAWASIVGFKAEQRGAWGSRVVAVGERTGGTTSTVVLPCTAAWWGATSAEVAPVVALRQRELLANST